MYLIDLEKLVIHDMSFARYECQLKKIPPEKTKKVYNIQTVKRMTDTDHVPRYNGCQFCLSELYTLDFTKLFR